MSSQCALCGAETTARLCRNGDMHLAHLAAWEARLIRRRRQESLAAIRRRVRKHTSIWERDPEGAE